MYPGASNIGLGILGAASGPKTLMRGHLELLFLSNSITGLSDTDPISTWPDSSGHGRDATGTTTTRPLYRTSIANGQPAVRFDGTDDYLQGTLPSLTWGDCTVFAVSKMTVNTNSAIFDSSTVGGATNTGHMLFHESGNHSYRYATSDSARTAKYAYTTTGTVMLHVGIRDGGTQLPSIYEKTTLKNTAVTATVGSPVLTQFRLGELFGHSFRWSGDLFAVGVYSAVASASDRAALTSWAQSTYGVV